MTVSAGVRRANYTGNGVTKTFSVPFQFFEIETLVDNEVVVDGVDYTVTQTSPGNTGTITFTDAPASAAKISIFGNETIAQGVDLVENDPFSAETIEDAFDRLTMIAGNLATRQDTLSSAEASAERAKDEADRAQSEADRAKDEADRAETEADRSTTQADRAESEADRSKDEADRSEAAASTVQFSTPSRTALKLTNPAIAPTAHLVEAGREGLFVWTLGNFSARVTADTQEGLYVASSSIPSSTGAWVRQYDGPVRAEWFGAKGDNSTLDTAAITAAVNLLTAIGGGTIEFLPGKTYLSAAIELKANVRLLGDARTATLKLDPTVPPGAFLNIRAMANVTVQGLTIDLNNVVGSTITGPVGIAVGASTNSKIIGNRFIGGSIRPYVGLNTTDTQRGLMVEDNDFTGMSTLFPTTPPNTQASQAIRFLAGPGSGDWSIRNNTARKVGNFLQIRAAVPQAFDLFDSVTISNNRVFDMPDDPNISTSPYECFCITGLSVTGNTIHTGGRGFSATRCKSAVFAGNTTFDQTSYFLEMQGCDGVTITGNTATNCSTFVNDTSYDPASKNISIIGNTVNGGSDGEPGFSTYHEFRNTIFMNAALAGYENWRIADNIFSGAKYNDTCIAINGHSSNGPKNIVIENNLFVQSEETCRQTAIKIARGSEVFIRHNTILRSANITDNTEAANATLPFIWLVPSACENVHVTGNYVNFTGADTRTAPTTGPVGIGAYVGAAPLPGLVVSDNTLIGTFWRRLYLDITSGDTIVADNNLLLAIGTDTLNAAIIRRRTKFITEATAAPTGGTWQRGDICWNSSPSASGVPGWVCVTAGTPGTWKAMAVLAA